MRGVLCIEGTEGATYDYNGYDNGERRRWDARMMASGNKER